MNKQGIGTRILAAAVCVALVGVAASPAMATTYTWTNSTAGTYAWTGTGNWDANGVPVGATDAAVQFFADITTVQGGGTYTVNTDPATLNLNVLTLNGRPPSTGSMTLDIGTAGNIWTFGGASPTVNLKAVRNTILPNYNIKPHITLGANTLVTGNGEGPFTFFGNIGGSYGLTKAGTSTLILSGNNNAFSGGITVNAGKVSFTTTNTLGNAVGADVTVNAGGTAGVEYGLTDTGATGLDRFSVQRGGGISLQGANGTVTGVTDPSGIFSDGVRVILDGTAAGNGNRWDDNARVSLKNGRLSLYGRQSQNVAENVGTWNVSGGFKSYVYSVQSGSIGLKADSLARVGRGTWQAATRNYVKYNPGATAKVAYEFDDSFLGLTATVTDSAGNPATILKPWVVTLMNNDADLEGIANGTSGTFSKPHPTYPTVLAPANLSDTGFTNLYSSTFNSGVADEVVGISGNGSLTLSVTTDESVYALSVSKNSVTPSANDVTIDIAINKTLTVTGGGIILNNIQSNAGGMAQITGAGTLAFGSQEAIIFGGDNEAGGRLISAEMTGTGGFTKFGPGTVYLSGANTISGAVNVNDGALRLAPAAVFPASITLNIEYGATVNLDSDVNQTVEALTLGGTSKADGEYTAITDPSFITGSGKITVHGPGKAGTVIAIR